MEALLKGTPIGVKSILQALLTIAWDMAQRDINDAVPPGGGKIRDVLSLAKNIPAASRDRTAMMSDRVESFSSAELHKHADEIAAVIGESGARHGPAVLPPSKPSASPSPTSPRRGKLDPSRGVLADSAIGVWARSAARQAEVREAIQLLMKTTLEERRILFAELLDLTSHRLDAFLTGVIERRRTTLKAAQGATPRWRGPDHRRLRLGREHHPRRPQRARRRVHPRPLPRPRRHRRHPPQRLPHPPEHPRRRLLRRRSLQRPRPAPACTSPPPCAEGQPLGAVLGYRIERALHESRLDRLTLTLRGLAPPRRRQAHRPQGRRAPAGSRGHRRRQRPRRRAPDRALQGRPRRPRRNPQGPQRPPEEQRVRPRHLAGPHGRRVGRASRRSSPTPTRTSTQPPTSCSPNPFIRSSRATPPAPPPPSTPPPAATARPPSLMSSAPRPPASPSTHRVMLLTPTQPLPGTPRAPAPRPSPRSNPGPSRASAHPPTSSSPSSATNASPWSRPASARWTWCTSPPIRAASSNGSARRSRSSPSIPRSPRAATPPWPAGQRAVGEIMVLAASIRSVLAAARPARPADLCRPNDPSSRTVSAASLDALRTRAVLARTALAARCQILTDALGPPGGTPIDPVQVAVALEDLAAFGVRPPDGQRREHPRPRRDRRRRRPPPHRPRRTPPSPPPPSTSRRPRK